MLCANRKLNAFCFGEFLCTVYFSLFESYIVYAIILCLWQHGFLSALMFATVAIDTSFQYPKLICSSAIFTRVLKNGLINQSELPLSHNIPEKI